MSETEARLQRFRSRRAGQRFAVLQPFWLLPGGFFFEIAFPQWVAGFPAWADHAVQAFLVASVAGLLVGGFAGFRCPICKAPFTDGEGSVLLFARIDACAACGTAIDPGAPAAPSGGAPGAGAWFDNAPGDDGLGDDGLGDDGLGDD